MKEGAHNTRGNQLLLHVRRQRVFWIWTPLPRSFPLNKNPNIMSFITVDGNINPFLNWRLQFNINFLWHVLHKTHFWYTVLLWIASFSTSRNILVVLCSTVKKDQSGARKSHNFQPYRIKRRYFLGRERQSSRPQNALVAFISCCPIFHQHENGTLYSVKLPVSIAIQ